ncbi:RNA-binding protein, putative [Babesia bigemina]|uniref:RNA-binding protein, putative n=1 Tax=Babesia bigemina TaxID=5866 RepID=A0A061DCZ3_BABBI|nr:RNA-binding protein, putative [Babesia bigemina]CDR95830.1 RNA-binding protein, putative [Babesia bigemina]|eukprot:XP_012768016.1 RNA-binding protein, putative [Babesia bigemina]
MSVTGPSANITAIERLSELELQQGIIGPSSWHHQYKDSCYIYIGGLDKRMTEGDIVIVFSQFGEPIDVHLKRDRKTGASLGYCFLGYKDQRSTILAVDNFNGCTLLGRRIRVDHVLDYKAPVEYEDEEDDEGNKIRKEYTPTGAEGQGIGKYYVTSSEAVLREAHHHRPKPQSNPQDNLDEDERWAQEFEASLRKDSTPDDDAKKHDRRSSSRSRHRHRERSRERHRKREDRERRRSRSRDRSRHEHRSDRRDRHRDSRRYR